MDINGIQQIINSSASDEQKEWLIIELLSKDESVIPMMMKILDTERRRKSALTIEMNVLLSKAHLGLDNNKINKDGFIQNEIVAF
jgi:hypothetical protein